jgi:phosphatidate cytidylyltransferase
MLRTRVYTALALLAGFLAILFFLPKPLPAVAFAVVAAVLAWEWGRLVGFGRPASAGFIALVLASCLLANGQAERLFPLLWLASAAFWLFVAPLWLWKRWPATGRPLLAVVVGWLLIIPTWAGLTALQERNPWWLFAAMALVWVADISAYFAGRAWGRHKLAPAISPGKTWEGVAGAVPGVLLYAAAGALIAGVRPPNLLVWALLLPALTAVSVVGDLFESLVKRQAGRKDSSGLLPGHGGFLDRLDSQTSTLPLAALILLGYGQ